MAQVGAVAGGQRAAPAWGIVALGEMQVQLLALEEKGGVGNIYDEEWLSEHPRPDIR